ncbi:MAG: NAD(P)-binding domain-containing protein, partial [Planctomycetaceae bacterium]|nr:NAD(P)-binding domain-containing protein [Planctomycetaceae bacterium]
MAVASKKVGFMGAGEIAEVLISNILANKLVKAKNITIFDLNPERRAHIKEKFGVNAASSNVEVVAASQYIFSCIRSEYVAEAVNEIKDCDMKGRAIVSISAGIPIMLFEQKLKKAAVARS